MQEEYESVRGSTLGMFERIFTGHGYYDVYEEDRSKWEAIILEWAEKG